MTSSGKVRIYELSKDLGLENKDVLDAAEKLSIAAKSHSSSISDDEAAQIRSLIKGGGNGAKDAAAPAAPKAILSVQKAPAAPAKPAAAPAPAKP
ncbi:MAG: translation initiation factor IF-2 N-terminal domain-containing protein, partial [Vulcanococcus sp.]